MEVPVDFGNLTTGKKIIAENFANWTSGNEIIDNFIREKQLKYGDVEDNSDDGEAVFEWIPYNELIDIKEIENNCFTKAKLKNGSLHYNRYNKEWIRRPYETVILRSLYDLQNVITEEFANKLESYLTYPVECYGVSQNPDTRVYILVFDNKISNHYCKTCGNEYEGRRYKWCKQCQIDQIKNNFTNWDDRIIKLDDFIQNMQLIINNYNVFKWIPYNEFIIVKELGNYTLAMWKKDRKVYLKHQHNLQENTDEFLNMLGSSVTSKIVIGISQNPNTKVYLSVFNDKYFNKYCEKCGYEYVIDKWCKQCEINQLRNNFINWTSGNVKLDEFIQKMQLNINRSNDIIFEWIPYNEFIIINELENYTLAIWKKGPLYSNYVEKSERNSCVKVYLRNLREITDEVLNEVESYLINKVIFGISQNPDTKVYLLVFHIIYFDRYCEKCGNKYGKYGWCKQCQINQLKNNFTNENVKFNDFIQKMQLMINEYNDRIFEWIPYNEFIISNESENCTLAIWEQDVINSVRKSYEKVYLKHLEITDEFLNKIESYLNNKCLVFGISQNPNTKVYVLVLDDKFFDYYCEKCDNKYKDGYGKWCIQCQINQLKSNFTNWTSGNIKLDNFIQKMQLNINNYNDKIFEWIPYNEVVIINKELGKHSTLAIWEKGSLYPIKNEKLIRNSHEKVYLKYMNNSQEITDEFLNKVESFLLNNLVSGISQNPDTKDYILVFNNYYIAHYCLKCENKYDENAYNYWCKSCEINRLKNDFADWTSGNEKIDDFIKKMQLKLNEYGDMIFEWIPYNKFIDVKEIRNSVFATAIWKYGPLYYSKIRKNYKRESDEKVLLKYLNNSQNINHTFLNEILYSVEESYGVSQNPNTKDFVLVFKLKYYCENCGKKYNNQFELNNKSCMSCQTNHENNKISDLIQEMKLNIDHNSSDSGMIFEWIPYDQFNDIKEIGKGGFSTVYSAIWKDGLLSYCNIGYGLSLDYKWKRESNTKVALKCLHNSQNFLDEFINEVKAYPNQKIDNILKIYGISQNPTTKDYIMVLEYAEGGDFNSYLNKKYEVFDWFNGLSVLTNTIEGLNKIHQKQMVHRDFHIGNILFTKFTRFDQYHNKNNESIDYVACISDMGLCKKIDDINETSIYGVMPYVAPEVLKGNPYTQAADIYSFGMIMYVIATGRQPFADCAHDGVLALKICNGIRPEINDKITPKCYIDLMKRCWDSNPDNRPNSIELKEFIDLFYNSLNQKFDKKEQIHHETETQFNETQEYRKENFLSIKNNQSTTHTQAIYTSRLLNSFTKNLSKYEDNFNNSTVEIIDFTT